jgi:hypothetical protein
MARQNSVVRPKDVLAEIDAVYPPTLDGTGVIPLSAETIKPLRLILKLVSQIPQDLRPTEKQDLDTLNGCINAIGASIQRTPGEPPYYWTLPFLATHPSKNLIALLREVLGRCPNFTPKENRRRLLELMAQYDKAGESIYPDTMAAGGLGIPLKEARRLMEICEDEGSLKLYKTHGGYSATLTPRGWKSLEEPDPATEVREKGIVFISCGQFRPEEIKLGRELAAAVDELPDFEGYFAQNQTSLDGLSQHIFGALNRCCGFVAVMHHRGRVETLDGERVRASVWVEQELAIAAFLCQAQKRDIAVVVYIQKGIAREGVRDKLLLGPVEFEAEADVLADFKARIADGRFAPVLAHP